LGIFSLPSEGARLKWTGLAFEKKKIDAIPANDQTKQARRIFHGVPVR